MNTAFFLIHKSANPLKDFMQMQKVTPITYTFQLTATLNNNNTR